MNISKNRLLFLVCYAIIEKEMYERGENAMAKEFVLDRAAYMKIKRMSREELV